MSEPVETPDPATAQEVRHDGAPPVPDRTRRMTLPPVPGRKRRAGRADEEGTDELPQAVREPTHTFGPWQPLHPRVVPRRRSRAPWVIGAVVVLVVAVGVVAYLVYGR